MKTAEKKRNLQATNQHLFYILIVFVLCCALSVFAVLYTMFARKHIWSQKTALTSSIAQSITTRATSGKRGTIYDRTGAVLAQETTAYTLVCQIDNRTAEQKAEDEKATQAQKEARLEKAKLEDRYEQEKAKIEKEEADYTEPYVIDAKQTAQAIASVLGDSVDAESIAQIIEKGIEDGRSQVELGAGTKRLDKSVKEELESKKIPGLGFLETTTRNYPTTPMASSLVGFATYLDETNSITGRMGLESSMDGYLSGTNGLMQYQRTLNGVTLPGTTKIIEEATNGNDLVLTLDANLQMVVEQQMQNTVDANNADAAWCLVMEVETGKILAWASYPSFDQNTHDVIPSYVDNISDAVYEPGSVMKPFVYATAIDTGVYPYNAEYRAGEFTYTVDQSTGEIIRLANGSVSDYPTIKDALGNDYGVLSFEEGLAHSSNVAICELLANYISKENFKKYMSDFGFGKDTGIPYVHESIGSVNLDDPTSYLSSGFGQATSVTWLELAQAYTAIFNDGVMMQPYVVESIKDSSGNTIEEHKPVVAGIPISADTASQVRDILRLVVQPGGSGEKFAMDGVDLIAKTGTGEIYNPETGTYDSSRFTSSIVAAAPYEDPKIMVMWGMTSTNYLNYSAEPFQVIMQQALIANSINGGTSESSTSPYDQWQVYTMPSLINHSLEYAQAQMEEKKVNTVIIGDGSAIVDQFPKAGTDIYSNDNVLLLTDGGSLTMPDLIGWTRKDLTAFWQMTGIAIECDGYGKVVWQSIDPGTPIQSDTVISVTLQ